MRLVVTLLLSLTVACGHARAPSSQPCRGEAKVAAPPPSEADVRQWSHAVLDAYDRGDVPTVDAALASGFVHFEGSTPTRKDVELAQLVKRKPGAPHIAKRSWSNEHVYVSADYALFIGQAAEQSSGNDSHGGGDYDGWYTLAWCREASAWKVSMWSWQRAGAAAERDTWNEMYRRGKGFEKEPNKLLVDAVQSVKPGAALDVATGQGRNALYLAARGWRVTAVDFSDEGLRIARQSAAEKKLALDAVNADIATYDFGVAKWDLVTMIYVPANVSWIEKVKPSLKPGGLFVLEYFHKDGPNGDGYTTGQLAALFEDGFSIVRDEVAEGTPDWAMDHGTLVRFVAKKR